MKKKLKKKQRSQPRLEGISRIPTGSAFTPELRKRLDDDAKEAGVSRSWVLAVIAADHYHMQTADYRANVRSRIRLLRRA